MPIYALPDGYTVKARGEADSDWNGFPVPILDPGVYADLVEHMSQADGDDGDDYYAEYVEDGKVTAGYYCDGLQWEIKDEEEEEAYESNLHTCHRCGAVRPCYVSESPADGGPRIWYCEDDIEHVLEEQQVDQERAIRDLRILAEDLTRQISELNDLIKNL